MSSQAWNPSLYDKAHSFIWKHGASLLELASVRDGELVLDLGCGTGHLTAKLAEAGARVLGVDKSAEMIAQAKATYPYLNFELADALDLPFDGEFDLVFSNATLHWVKPPERAAECISRALKPDGRLVLEMGGKGNIARIISALFKTIADTGHPVAPEENPWYFPSVSEYTSVLEARGLEVVYAVLFDRPTPLEGEDGLRDWLEMFAGGLLNKLSEKRQVGVIDAVEEALRPALYRDGIWTADYRRLRVVAVKPG